MGDNRIGEKHRTRLRDPYERNKSNIQKLSF